MAERWVGFAASGKSVIVVGAQIPDDEGDPIEIVYDQTWPIQEGAGARPAAYHVLYQQCLNHLRGAKADRAFIKASATSRAGMSKAHLDGAEVRGVVTAAAAAICPVAVVPQAQISKHYGGRKVEEYVKDEKFWKDKTTGGKLRSGSRVAAMLLIAARGGE
jgi:hypothetical protein